MYAVQVALHELTCPDSGGLGPLLGGLAWHPVVAHQGVGQDQDLPPEVKMYHLVYMFKTKCQRGLVK